MKGPGEMIAYLLNANFQVITQCRELSSNMGFQSDLRLHLFTPHQLSILDFISCILLSAHTLKTLTFTEDTLFINWLTNKNLSSKCIPRRNIGFPCGSAGKESACNVGELGLIPGLGRSPGEGNHYMCIVIQRVILSRSCCLSRGSSE